MDYLKELNDKQHEAVTANKQFIRVIAGAGSGKTRVLTTRLLYLVDALGYHPSRLCAITFTNKAAREMKERLEPYGIAQAAHISTIHSLCVRILREEYEAADLPRYFTIIDTSDQQTILRSAYRYFNLDAKSYPMKDVVNAISYYKSNFILPEDAKKKAFGEDEKLKADLYEYYEASKKKQGALDFDDILLEVYYLFERDQSVLDKWQHRFDVLCVDEFQDVDHIQYRIIRWLVGKNNELYVVGDPDQTIYTWRGANVRFIMNFPHDFPDSQTVFLTVNYRSSQTILDTANRLIQYNENREDKNLESVMGEGAPIVYEGLNDAEEEAYWIASKVENLYDSGEKLSDIAILYRSNYLSRSLEKTLRNYDIPYVVYGGMSFFDRLEIKVFLAYLEMVTLGSDLALKKTVQTPRQGIGQKTVENYEEKAQKDDVMIYDVMLEEYREGKASKAVSRYVEKIEMLRESEKTEPKHVFLNRILEDIGLQEHFKERKEEARIDNMRELMGDIVSYFDGNPESNLASYLQMISLYTDRETKEDSDAIALMTVHAAKGLEFKHVFIMGLSDYVFPNRRSIEESMKGLEEERRLMYVAVTRAKEYLYLSHHGGHSFIHSTSLRPSRFLYEMGILDRQRKMQSVKVENTIMGLEASTEFRNGDRVVHPIFGDGIVIGQNQQVLEIAFPEPHRLKKIAKSFDGLKRKESS